jgi:LuxR family maltose regulon positive regulatory protein
MHTSRSVDLTDVRSGIVVGEAEAGPVRRGATPGRPSSALVHRGRLEPPFFQAKLRSPARPRHFVRRDRLARLLDDLTDYPITAIVAPAGAGKTVLAADWFSRRKGPGTWLSLDATDADVDELWRSLVVALDRLVPGTALQFAGEAPTAETLSMLGRIPRADSGLSPAMLVLDNVDRIGDGAAGAALTSFAETLTENRPTWLHLLLLSRRRPPLPVERLRGRGDLADMQFEALRFSGAEATALLGRLCPDLPSTDLRVAARRANGWAAALQLTALAIRSQPVPGQQPVPFAVRYPGTERLVDEYLWKEVLQPVRPDLVRLLLSTAVVGRLNYGLAEALNQRSDAGDLLEDAEAAGLFLTALDGGWFELHSLVRDMLLTRLQRRWPEGLRELHARAAQWFEGTGDPLAGLDHWLQADRPIDALRSLAELSLPLLEAGRSARVADALDQLAPEVATTDPDDAARYAWCQLATGQEAFLSALSLAESVPADPGGPRTALLRAVASWLGGDWPVAATTAREALTRAPIAAGGDAMARFGWHLVSSGIALDERWNDRGPAVREARAACLRDSAGRWSFEGTRAIGLALAGRPTEASRAIDGAKHAAGGGRFETLRIELALAEAVVALESDDRKRADVLLEELAGTPSYPNPILQLLARLELVRSRLAAGDLSNAAIGLDEAEALSVRLAASTSGSAVRRMAPLGGAPGSLVARIGCDLALGQDDPATAVRWAGQLSDPFWRPVSEAKISLARGRAEQAAIAVQRATPRCPRHQVIACLLKGRAVSGSDRRAAEEAVATAVDLAVGHGMLRTVAADGAGAIELVERAAWRAPGSWMDRLRHALAPAWSSPEARRPIDDLTDRERDVLRLLPSRLTLSEIASELYVSQNTLKFHLRGIYRKLGVDSRAQAVGSARHMRRLPRG